MNPTLDDLIEAFTSEVDGIGSDTVEPDAEELFLRTIIAELEAVKASFLGLEDTMGDTALSVAVNRVPGLLHLYKIY